MLPSMGLQGVRHDSATEVTDSQEPAEKYVSPA